ncbi:hypothetical protein H9L39_06125, partial [Fusarium oxysporum f. sp. albedinis]
MNYLYIGINKRIKFLNLLIDKAKPETFAAKDDNRNIPLYLAVSYENCKREQLKYVKIILEKDDWAIFNIDHQTKYGGSIPIQAFGPVVLPVPSVAPDAADTKKKATGKSGAFKSKKSKKSGSKSDPVDKIIIKGIQYITDFKRLIFNAKANYAIATRSKVSNNIKPIQVTIINNRVNIKDLNYRFIGSRSFYIYSKY